jgi:hypothetical protein
LDFSDAALRIDEEHLLAQRRLRLDYLGFALGGRESLQEKSHKRRQHYRCKYQKYDNLKRQRNAFHLSHAYVLRRWL